MFRLFASRNQRFVSARRVVHLIVLLSLLLGYAPAPLLAAPPDPDEPVIEEPAGLDQTGVDPQAGVSELVEDPTSDEEPLVPLSYEEIEAAGSEQTWPADLPTPEAEEQEQGPEGLSSSLYLPLVSSEAIEEEPAIIELGEDLPDSAFAYVEDEPLLETPELAADAFVEEFARAQKDTQGYLADAVSTISRTDPQLGVTFAYDPRRWVPTLLADNGIHTADGVSIRALGLASVAGEGWLFISAFHNTAGLTLQQWIDRYDYVRTDTVPVRSERMIAGFPAIVLRENPEVYTGSPPSWRGIVSANERVFVFEYAVLQPDEQVFEMFLNTIRLDPPAQRYIPSILSSDVNEPLREAQRLSSLNEGIARTSVAATSCCGVTDPEYNPFPCDAPGAGNCTWWVRYRRTGDNKANLYLCIHAANTWDECAAQNYPDLLSDSPSPGAAAVWLGAGENHVQFVEWLNGSGSIHVSEMNYPWGGNPGTCQRDFDQNRTWTIKYIQMPGSSGCPAPQQNSPGDGETLSSRTVSFSWQSVNCGQGFTFRVKDTSDMDSGGTTLIDTGEGGTSRTETFGSEWDNRDLYWGVKAANVAGAQWAVRRFRISPGGPPPGSCDSPGADQAAVFQDPDYRGGCNLLGIGEYSSPSSFPNVGNDNVSSLKVGSNVRVTLFENEGFSGRSEPFESDRSNLAGTGIGDSVVSSIKVERRTPPNNCPQNTPNSDQAIIFADTGYGGSCVVLGIGDYPNPSYFGSVGNDNASSIRVGSNVRLRLCLNDNYESCDTFEGDDDDLGNNGIGNNNASSAKVEQRVYTPTTPSLASPDNGAMYDEGQSVVLSWNGANATDYYGEITGGPSALSFGWQGDTYADLGPQWAGYHYTWRVKARRGDQQSDWSESRTFTIRPGAPTNLSASSPGCGKVNLTWGDGSGSEEGYRIYRNGNPVAVVGADVTAFAQSSLPAGMHTYKVHAYRSDIQSLAGSEAQVTVSQCVPAAKLGTTVTPATQVHNGVTRIATRFTLRESAGTAVAIQSYSYRWYSADGKEAFGAATTPAAINLNLPAGGSANWSVGLQLPRWVAQMAADRGDIAVRLYMTFRGVDSVGRAVKTGAHVTLGMAACSDATEPNNARGKARTITYGQTLNGVMCPAGELDLFTFSGTAGDRIRIAARPRSGVDTLNPKLELLRRDGSVLATNDNRAAGLWDARIGIVLPATDKYYIRVTDTKRRGGPQQGYQVLLHQDSGQPVAAIRTLAGGTWLHAKQQVIRVDASDRQTEIDHITFYARLPGVSSLQLIGADYTAGDGWRITWDTSKLPAGTGYGIIIRAVDGAGNYRDVGKYNLRLERTPPTVKAAASASYGDAPFRAFVVKWNNGRDAGSGLLNYDIQVRKGTAGSWTNWITATTSLQARYVGAINQTYYFRARARDKTGTVSAYAGGNGDSGYKISVCPVAKDRYETDDSAATAKAVRSDGTRYSHNFHAEGNVDWLKFTVAAGATYVLRTYMVGKHADTVLTLYKSDGKTVLASNDDLSDATYASRITWKSPAYGTYYVQVKHYDRYGYGCTTGYNVAVTKQVAAGSGLGDVTGDPAGSPTENTENTDNGVDGEPTLPGDLPPLDDEVDQPPVGDAVDQIFHLFLPLTQR